MPRSAKFYQREYFAGVIIAIMMVIFYAASNRLTTDTTQPKIPTPTPLTEVTPETAPKSPRLLYLVELGQNEYVMRRSQIDPVSPSDIVKFSLPRPFISIAGYTPNQALYVVVQAETEFQGAVMKVQFDGKVESVVDRVVYIQPPVISHDQRTLLYVTFSNAEKDFGFKIIEFTLQMQLPETIATSPTGLTLPRYCFDLSICYIRQLDGTKSEIVKLNKASKDIEVLLESSRPIIELTVSDQSLTLIDRGSSGDRIISLQDKTPQVIGDQAERKKQALLSLDRQTVAYIALAKPTDRKGKTMVTSKNNDQLIEIDRDTLGLISWEN